MQVQLENKVYEKLKHDADDNKAIIKIVKWVCILLIFLVCHVGFGNRLINMCLDRLEAHNTVYIRNVEMADMSTEDYLKWYEIKSSSSGDI